MFSLLTLRFRRRHKENGKPMKISLNRDGALCSCAAFPVQATKVSSLFALALVFCLGSLWADTVSAQTTGARSLPVETTGAGPINETVTSANTFYVDSSGNHADVDTGTSDNPFGTVQAGVDAALAKKNANIPARVRVRNGIDGTYREQVFIGAPPSGAGDTNAPLIIEAAIGATPVISGSDIRQWTNWVDSSNSTGIYQHKLNYNYPINTANTYALSAEGAGTTFDSSGPESLVLRREMVFVNGKTLRQVATWGALEPGTFYLDGAEDNTVNLDATGTGARNTLYVMPPLNDELTEPIHLNGANFEFAVRGYALKMIDRKYVVLRGLTFEHATHYQNAFAGGGVVIGGGTLGCENILIDSCTSRRNNGRGLMLIGGGAQPDDDNDKITLRGCSFNWNGVQGIKVRRIKDLLVQDCQTSYNNFRGSWGGKVSGWEPGGFKVTSSRRTTWIGHTSTGNWGRGMWWDTDNKSILARNCLMEDNRGSGLFIEYNQGPALVEDCTITGTLVVFGDGVQDAGLNVSSSLDVTLLRNVCRNNAKRQFGLWVIKRGEFIGHPANGYDYQYPNTLLTIEPQYHTYSDNVFQATGTQGLMLFPSKTDRAAFYSSSVSNNTFWLPVNADLKAFQWKSTSSDTLNLLKLYDWKIYSGMEQNSVIQRW